ncbi:MAG: putative methyltransferase CheR with domain [Conexibacter sp.]|jgi:two-component system CheB/CheR fusion protein|nr:putative methyltransferase CheR with domain [Conexibacter sp.]MDX6733739.1 two-component system, chemotaxis family, CheB/CheR fusion protein [Baekduia sp.]
MTLEAETTIDGLLQFVKRHRGFDFTGYKRSSLERRIGKRMQQVGSRDPAEYQDFLEVHPDEFAELFNTILINVTAFFRDASLWDHLRAEVLPALLSARAPDAPIRVWCAGCASGEEPYTVAMVLSELLGDATYCERVKIYATDVDEDALQTARQASYTAKQVEAIPAEALDRCFALAEGRYVFRPDLRRTVIFGRNDLVQDAPISRVDLLLCRNTLMYFNAETQSRILQRFQFGLDPAGVLVLGKSEMLLTHGDLFSPIDLKRRVFRKVSGAAIADLPRLAPDPGNDGAGPAEPSLRDSAFEAGLVAQLILDAHGTVVSVNQAARTMFGLDGQTVGRALQDLELSYRPVELRSHLDRLRHDGQSMQLRTVGWNGDGGQSRVLDVELTPLRNSAGLEGASISYVDVTHAQSLQDELERSKRDLEQAYEELQSTVEELETTNEELQSTNEELETTNEELQSTNEELETMNEELQSTNEELETINEELRSRSIQLDEANAFLERILATMGVAVAVLDAVQTVRVWNRQAGELWGVRADEAVGQHFLNLDIGLPVRELRASIKAALAGEEDQRIVVDATDRRGRALGCQVHAMPLTVGGDAVTGVILLMERAEG